MSTIPQQAAKVNKSIGLILYVSLIALKVDAWLDCFKLS